MLDELVKEYRDLKEEAAFSVRLSNMLESLTYALENNKKDTINYFTKRSRELLEEYYGRGTENG